MEKCTCFLRNLRYFDKLSLKQAPFPKTYICWIWVHTPCLNSKTELINLFEANQTSGRGPKNSRYSFNFFFFPFHLYVDIFIYYICMPIFNMIFLFIFPTFTSIKQSPAVLFDVHFLLLSKTFFYYYDILIHTPATSVSLKIYWYK